MHFLCMEQCAHLICLGHVGVFLPFSKYVLCICIKWLIYLYELFVFPFSASVSMDILMLLLDLGV